MPFGEDDVLATYVDDGEDVVYGAITTTGLLRTRQQRLTTDAAGATIQVTEDILQYALSELTLVENTEITIGGATYRIRELRTWNRLEGHAVVVPA